ncbi:MAG TPA: hypothetical protein VII21_08100 [Aestuariivirga sp.]
MNLTRRQTLQALLAATAMPFANSTAFAGDWAATVAAAKGQ